MKNEIPAAYWRFRWAWSVLHLCLLALLAVGALIWASTDEQGARALSHWWEWSRRVQDVVFHFIPFPWSD